MFLRIVQHLITHSNNIDIETFYGRYFTLYENTFFSLVTLLYFKRSTEARDFWHEQAILSKELQKEKYI